MIERSYLLFSAGGLALAADSASVHCIHDDLTVQPEDQTVDWFLGLAVANERLLPITDLGVYLNGNASFGRIIEVARHFGIVGLKIDDVQGVSKKHPEPFDSDQTVNGDQTVNDANSSLKSMAVIDLGRHYQIIDIASLLQSSRFLNVQHEPA